MSNRLFLSVAERTGDPIGDPEMEPSLACEGLQPFDYFRHWLRQRIERHVDLCRIAPLCLQKDLLDMLRSRPFEMENPQSRQQRNRRVIDSICCKSKSDAAEIDLDTKPVIEPLFPGRRLA